MRYFSMLEKRKRESNYFLSKKAKRLVFLAFFCIIFLSLVSSVSAANFNPTNGTSANIQSAISGPDTTIVLSSGNYTNIININVTKRVTIEGNGQVNIIGPGSGTLFNITSNIVTIKNLNISGYTTAITSNQSQITITNNNINTTGDSIIFTGTNSRDIRLENNSIRSSGGRGVNITVPTNSVVGITFNNNNITGTNYGVYLKASSSNNTITFSNNNITGTTSRGVYLEAYSSNNTITFNNNNITGTSYGVYLYAYSSNNTITFSNNNITGTDNGVSLYADRSNNTILRFVGNNIKGNTYAMYIYCYGNVNGLSLLNNIFTSNDIGLYFNSSSSSNVLSNINVTGNSIKATNVGIGFYVGGDSSTANVTLNFNYNSILATIGVDSTYSKITSIASNFDYNWWGSNDGPSRYYLPGLTINNYYTMKISTPAANLDYSYGDGLPVSYSFVLNGTNDNHGAATKLPYFTVPILINGKVWKNIDARLSSQYNVPLSSMEDTISLGITGVLTSFKYKANKASSNLVFNTLKAIYNKPNTITVVLTDKNNNVIADKLIKFYVNGNEVVGSYMTNSEGVASFKYTFKTRKIHTIVAKFAGDTYYFDKDSTFNPIPKDISTINLAKFSAKKGKKTTFKATLKVNNKAMKGKYINFYAKGKPIGKAKTNAKGIATLTKKITVKGVINFVAIYAGDKNSHDSSYTRKVNVK